MHVVEQILSQHFIGALQIVLALVRKALTKVRGSGGHRLRRARRLRACSHGAVGVPAHA